MELVVDDAYIESVREFLKRQSDELGDLIYKYIRTMNSVIEMGFMEGKTADAVKEFLNQIESQIGSDRANPEYMDSKIERLCINFVERIDKADKDLY